eukprot:TRINITY_DN19280_c0_g1_i1.p3 TRINITY_DN19280_c0_g1~~TRINITY_DN19280_c0_g1_i1.p3  ORF type:complete len:174 (-),score=13.53 TRINITY_DN19280_c0_g1_i1:17-475(-)
MPSARGSPGSDFSSPGGPLAPTASLTRRLRPNLSLRPPPESPRPPSAARPRAPSLFFARATAARRPSLATHAFPGVVALAATPRRVGGRCRRGGGDCGWMHRHRRSYRGPLPSCSPLCRPKRRRQRPSTDKCRRRRPPRRRGVVPPPLVTPD